MCLKILGKLIFFTECQSGFVIGDACIAQLLLIPHEIYKVLLQCNERY